MFNISREPLERQLAFCLPAQHLIYIHPLCHCDCVGCLFFGVCKSGVSRTPLVGDCFIRLASSSPETGVQALPAALPDF